MAENIFSTLNIAGQGMSVQRKRLTAVANNIANVNTTSSIDGTPYQRQVVVTRANNKNQFATELDSQMNLSRTNSSHAPNAHLNVSQAEKDSVTAEIVGDGKPARIVYDPNHPDADGEGYVHYPDINIVTEMVDMITAQRGFEANTQMISTAKNIARYSLDI
ncbi:MAG: flagellar basal body rod protein FlgC [Ignavibacteria bacterium]|jgi:flagellar basal-body rod protein FlgC|nr:flagellar basal body rod protein FlgC [Ignavibacteria bacterium]